MPVFAAISEFVLGFRRKIGLKCDDDEEDELKRPQVIDAHFILNVLQNNRRKARCFSRKDAKSLVVYTRRPLGSGNFGRVFLIGNRKTWSTYAVKVVAVGVESEKTPKEAEIHRAITGLAGSRDHVIQLFSHFVNDSSHFYIMEFANSGTLSNLISRKKGDLSVADAEKFFRQLLQAVAFLHSHGFAHLDISLENCLLTTSSLRPHEQILKLCDFGCSVRSRDRQGGILLQSIPAGSPNSAAPEVFNAATRPFDPEMADIWSCGIQLVKLLTAGKLPWCVAFMKDVEYVHFTLGDFIHMELWRRVMSSGALGCILSMLKVDPAARASAAQLLLSTPLFTASDFISSPHPTAAPPSLCC